MLVILLLSLLPLATMAQYKLSDKPDEFIADVSAMMASTKNAEAIKAGQDFETLWSTRLSESQRQKMIVVSKKMAAKRYKAATHFGPLFKTFTLAINTENIPSAELDNLLATTEKVIEQYDSKQVSKYLETLQLFFEKKALFTSNYNRLYAQGGSYSFAFKEAAPTNTFEEQPADKQEEIKQEEEVKQENSKPDDWFSSWDTPETQTQEEVTEAAPPPVTQFVFTKPLQPDVVGAVVTFNNVNIVFATSYDSVQLAGTSGSLMLKDGIFVGNGGKFDWSMAGLPEVYCDIKEYNFDIRSPKLTAEGVTLNYPQKLDAPVEGVFEFLSKKHKGVEDVQYPRFMSFYNNIGIKNVGPNLVYKGGFSLVGNRNFSNAVNNLPATLNYVVDGAAKFKSTGYKYEFADSLVLSPQISVVIPQNRDSIYHPGVKLHYDKRVPLLRLNKHDGGFKNTAFVDTYHKVDIMVDGLQWDMNTDSINFYVLNARHEVPGVFESYDFFDSTRYVSLKGIYNFHPLQLLMSYANSEKVTSFYVGELASKFKLNENTLRGALIQMMQQGYIDFNAETGYIKMNRKGDHNVLANNKKKDYDSFRIESINPAGPNATLNLSSNELVVRGIERFYLSNKLNVSIKPRNKEIKLLKDRNFLLDGEVAAGTYKFKGAGFFFLYDEFTVEMPQIDTILFTARESLKKGDRKELGGEIRYGAGTLYINKPNNKAGSKDFPEYPRLNVESGATIYFDQKERQAGTYNRNVRFEIPSVKLDSLNSKDPDYKGTFYSDGIFPPFKEALVPMSDNTLGFRHKPATASYNLYDSQSSITFTSDIIMDTKGLRTSGTIEHLSTTLTSKDILFTPDSVVAKGPAVDIKEATVGGGSFPKVHVKNYDLIWLPRADSMVITNTTSPFEIYTKTGATFNGKMIVRSNGLFGTGTLDRKDSEIYSAAFNFDQTKFTANDAEFRIKSNILTKPVLFANFVNLDFDFGKGLVTINTSSNPELAGFASLEFPYAAYKTSINKAKWDIGKKSVLMEGDVKTTTFTSIEPSQENLSFNARFALYNIEKYTLNIGGIPFIQSADARIVPKNGVIRVLENAVMEPLTEAKLSIDTVFAYHNLFDGNIQILSKSKFIGNATYKYTNTEKQEFNIKLGDFELREEEVTKKNQQPRRYTAAQGEVSEEDNFFVAPRILFKGKVTMLAPDKFLKLDGFIKLDLKSQSSLGAWLPYKSNQENENIVITVDENLNSEGIRLTTGLHFDKGTSSLYTTFLSEKDNQEDKDILLATGQLNYNPNINEFRVSTVERANNVTYEESQYILNDAKGKVRVEGKLDLFNSVPNEYMMAAGTGEVDLNSNIYTFNTLLGFNFALPMQAVSLMGESIIQSKLDKGIGEKEAHEDREALFLKIAALAGNGAAKDYKDKASRDYVPLTKVSKRFITTMVLSNVDLKWSEDSKTLYSVGKIGFSNVATADINSQFDGMVEIRKNPAGDEVSIYIELTPDDWYYFNFAQNQLQALSTNEKFNNIISNKGKLKKEGQYSFTIASMEDRVAFVDRFNREYKGINKPLEVKNPEIKTPEATTPEINSSEEKPAEENAIVENKKEARKKKGKKTEDKIIEPEQTQEEKVVEKKPQEKKEEEKKDGF